MGFEKVRWEAKRCRDLSDVLNVCVLAGVVCGIRFPLCFLPQQVLIDARGHLLGRLASIIAKSLLCGECEGVRPFSLIPYHASSQWRNAFILCVSWLLPVFLRMELELFAYFAAGQRVVVVRCEELNQSGSFYRNKCK